MSVTPSSPVPVLVPYSRFLEYQDRRRRIAAELTRRDQPPPLDVTPAPAEMDLHNR